MTIRHYLVTMALATLLCWVSWVLVLINIDPFTANNLGLTFFYSSLLAALTGSFSLLLFFIYKSYWKNEAPIFAYVAKSFREGIFISGFTVLGLFLWGQNWLGWWTGSLIVIAFILMLSLIISLAPNVETNSSSPNNFI